MLDRFQPRESTFPQTKWQPTGAARIIGAACGAFVFAFVAIMASVMWMNVLGPRNATLFWGSALVIGAVGGFKFPRIGHFLCYGFIVYMNVMLSMVIGRNAREQVTLFLLFGVLEIYLYMARRVIRNRSG